MEINKINNEIEITLITSLPEEYQIQNNRLSVPTNYDTEKLTKLVNKLLNKINTEENPHKFLFFINNVLLDSNLSFFLTTYSFDLQKVSETGLIVNYALEIPPPELINTLKEDEWIRKIVTRKNQKYDILNPEPYVVGLFNSELTMYSPSFDKIFKMEEENSENKENEYCELLHDILFFSKTDSLSQNTIIKASRNEDSLLSIYSVDLSKGTYTKNFHVGKDSEYCNSLSLNPVDFTYFAGGNSDGTIRLYKLVDENSFKLPDSNKKTKKRKTETQSLSHEMILENCHGPNEVKIIKWINNGQILSTGDDFYIKLWNIQTRSLYSSFNSNFKITTCISSILGNEKFLTGHDDGSIRLWDMRNENTRIVFNNAHSKFVSDLITNPDINLHSQNFSSVGYDGKLKMWDLRAMNKPLLEISTESEKNYTLAFNTAKFILTGGDKSVISIYENKI